MQTDKRVLELMNLRKRVETQREEIKKLQARVAFWTTDENGKIVCSACGQDAAYVRQYFKDLNDCNYKEVLVTAPYCCKCGCRMKEKNRIE